MTGPMRPVNGKTPATDKQVNFLRKLLDQEAELKIDLGANDFLVSSKRAEKLQAVSADKWATSDEITRAKKNIKALQNAAAARALGAPTGAVIGPNGQVLRAKPLFKVGDLVKVKAFPSSNTYEITNVVAFLGDKHGYNYDAKKINNTSPGPNNYVLMERQVELVKATAVPKPQPKFLAGDIVQMTGMPDLVGTITNTIVKTIAGKTTYDYGITWEDGVAGSVFEDNLMLIGPVLVGGRSSIPKKRARPKPKEHPTRGTSTNDRDVANRGFVLEDGVYMVRNLVMRASTSRTTGFQYASIWEPNLGKFEKVPGGIREIRRFGRVATVAEIESYAKVHKVCMVCGRKIKTEESVKRGIGPVCRKRIEARTALINR